MFQLAEHLNAPASRRILTKNEYYLALILTGDGSPYIYCGIYGNYMLRDVLERVMKSITTTFGLRFLVTFQWR